MRYVILARDRRKKKKRIRNLIFLFAMLAMSVGIFLSFSDQTALETKNEENTIALDWLDEGMQVDDLVDNQGVKSNLSVPTEKIQNTQQEKNTPNELNLAFIPKTEKTEKKVEIKSEINADKTKENAAIEIDTRKLLADAEEDDSDEKEDLSEDVNATSYVDITESDDEEIIQGVGENLEEKQSQTQEQAKKAIKETLEKPKNELPVEAEKAIADLLDVADEALRIQDQFSYVVTKGDRLRNVLEQSGLGRSVANNLIRQYPALGKLEAGQQFYWVLDNQGELEYMNWLVSEKEERVYERKANGKFSYQSFEKKGVWREDVVRGVIQGSFANSLKNVGLSDRQINQLAVGLQSQIATSKLSKGDRFAILVKREYINGKVTDVGNVEGIVIARGNQRYYAIQAENGRYYNNQGEAVSRGFARIPLLSAMRVSSPFNPRRLHPITKQVRPHKGTDFALPVGTPIVAPGDGVVDHVAFQARGAGLYIRIRHGHISTVYMHLSKTMVKVGQKVRKGERIALSGNTGASTGPHLHYEFHINGIPVNAMTVKLPGSGGGMESNERKNFLPRAKKVLASLKL